MTGFSTYRLQRYLADFFTYLGIAAALIFFLFPFAWILTTSLKGGEDYFTFPPVWIPHDPSLVHYHALFDRGNG